MAARTQETAQVVGINTSVVVLVNGAVGSEDGIVVADFEVTLQDVESALQIDFLLEDVQKSMLDVARKRVEATDTLSRSVNSDVAEQVVFAGEEHLHETKKGTELVKCFRRVMMMIWGIGTKIEF